MAEARNHNRSYWRTKCRRALSDHIWKTLKIRVDPADVRLIPNVNTSYRWKAAPSIKQLLKMHISKHSIRAYKTLCQVVDENLEKKLLQAAFAEELLHVSEDDDDQAETGSINTGSHTILARNEEISEELVQWKLQAACEVKRRELAEETIENLKRLSEEQQAKIIHLEGEAKQWLSTTKFFQQVAGEWLQRVTEAISPLQTVQSEPVMMLRF
ncbi:hypothetical protein ACJ73_01576 [Blastomyces percursus]|uniref:Uncharacterized protein n=1 Tax=Blastomyces percursus TaxID=1658174 RepID=A0A1J9REM0_9EURO|nr:hypothetical protein ACJ73_01576 [Blastomyces percursus]